MDLFLHLYLDGHREKRHRFGTKCDTDAEKQKTVEMGGSSQIFAADGVMVSQETGMYWTLSHAQRSHSTWVDVYTEAPLLYLYPMALISLRSTPLAHRGKLDEASASVEGTAAKRERG
jgi:hypothetical protein